MNIEEAPLALFVIAMIVLGIGIVVGPLFSIWALNCLFGLEIPITLWTWLSSLWFNLLFASTVCKIK